MLSNIMKQYSLRVATTPTVYGIETEVKRQAKAVAEKAGCNNTYRLRY